MKLSIETLMNETHLVALEISKHDFGEKSIVYVFPATSFQ